MKFLKNIVSRDWQEKLSRSAERDAPKEGQHGRPSPNSKSLDQNETSYKNAAIKLVQKARNTAFGAIQKLGDGLVRQQQSLHDVRASTENRTNISSIQQDVKSHLSEHKERLKDCWKSRIECSGRLNAFKTKNQVAEEPNHPEDKMHYLSLVFLILVIEGGANAFFWKGDGGLIQGFIYAVVFAFMNIAVAFIFGLGFRYRNRGEIRDKLLGWLCLVTAIFSAFRLAAWIASQRSNDSLDMLVTGVIPTDLDKAFSTIPGVFLFALTILAAVYAFYKGHGFLGTIPGYARVVDDFRLAADRAEAVRAEALRVCRTHFDSAIRVLESAATKLNDVRRQSNSTLSDFMMIRSEFETTVDEIYSGYSTIMAIYKQTNLASRPDNVPGPSYWSEPLELDRLEPDNLESQIAVAEGILREADAMRVDLSPILEEEKNHIQEARAEFLEVTWAEYVADCKQEAQQEFESDIQYIKGL